MDELRTLTRVLRERGEVDLAVHRAVGGARAGVYVFLLGRFLWARCGGVRDGGRWVWTAIDRPRPQRRRRYLRVEALLPPLGLDRRHPDRLLILQYSTHGKNEARDCNGQRSALTTTADKNALGAT